MSMSFILSVLADMTRYVYFITEIDCCLQILHKIKILRKLRYILLCHYEKIPYVS